MQSTLESTIVTGALRCSDRQGVSSTYIKYYHKEQIQLFLTQRLYGSQQRLLEHYFFPGCVDRMVRFGFGECAPWGPVLLFPKEK